MTRKYSRVICILLLLCMAAGSAGCGQWAEEDGESKFGHFSADGQDNDAGSGKNGDDDHVESDAGHNVFYVIEQLEDGMHRLVTVDADGNVSRTDR